MTLVVATPELRRDLDLAGLGVGLLTFDDLLGWSGPSPTWSEPDPQGPIAVVFTSGTTSRPKGVVHSLDTLRAGARNMAEALALTEQDVAFLSTPVGSPTVSPSRTQHRAGPTSDSNRPSSGPSAVCSRTVSGPAPRFSSWLR